MGDFEVGGLLGNCGRLRDTVEPCLCRDGHRSVGLMGWWWETEMSRNRQPFRVGLVREAWWGPSSLPLTELARGELTGGGTRKKEGNCPTALAHFPLPYVYYFCMWPEPAAHGLKGTYSTCPPKMLWSITPLCYPSEEKKKNKTSGQWTYMCHASR